MNCDNCLNSRPIISENGIHYTCTLPPKKALDCRLKLKDRSIHLNDSGNEPEAKILDNGR